MTLPASTHALDFRSATLTTGVPVTVSGTAAAITIPAGATLGTISGQQGTLVEVILNNAGTLEKAVVNVAGGNDLSETGVISTTAISAGATAANVFYSNTARSNVAYRLVRSITSTQTTAGQWSTPPSLVQGQGGQALSAMSSLGYGQTWQNVTGSRALGTNYYNTTGKPIAVIAGIGSNAAAWLLYSRVGGVQIAQNLYGAQGAPQSGQSTVVVQPGQSYSFDVSSGTGYVQSWFELR